MKKVLLLLLMVLVMFASCEKKAVEKIYVIASDCTWPPMEMIDENQNIIGFDIDLIKAIAQAGGFKIEIKNTAWDGIFTGLVNDSYDAVISSVTITDDRKKTMDFSAPYIHAGQILIVPKASRAVSLADLAGKKVGAQIGTTGAYAIEETNGELKNYDEMVLAIEDLINGNLAGVVCDTPIAAYYVLNNEIYKGALKIAGEPFTDEYYGICVKKGNSEFLAMINDGLAKIKTDGTITKLENKWLR